MKLSYISFFILGVAACVSLSCNPPTQKNKEKESNSFLTATNGVELDSRLISADSLVFVFYKNPYDSDSLRYTRFYTQYVTTAGDDISLLLKNLEKPFTKLEKVKNCRSEGKIWCYTKGHIFQTVYFSTRCNDCCFIYFIKDGYFFYMELNEGLLNRLALMKPLATEIFIK